MLAFGGLEADGLLDDLLPSSQAHLTILTREINNLEQQATSRSQRRSASRGIGLQRMGTTEFLSCTQGAIDFNPSTYGALQRSDA